MVVNYDIEDGWSNLFDMFKSASEITDEVRHALEELGRITIFDATTAEELGKQIGYTDQKFFEFAKQADRSGDLLQQYTDYMRLGTSAAKKFGAAIKSIGANMAIMLAINTAITIAYKVWDHFAHAAENAKEEMDEAVASYEENKSELDSINKELEKNKKLIEELSSKENLTYTEEAELQKLIDINEQLSIQQKLKEKLDDSRAKEAVEESIEAYKKNYKSGAVTEDSLDEYRRLLALDVQAMGAYGVDGYSADEKNLSSMIAAYEGFIDLKNQALAEKNYEAADSYLTRADEIEASIWEQVEALQEYKDVMSAIPYNELGSNEQKVFDEISATIQNVWKLLDPAQFQQLQIDKLFNTEGIKVTKDQLIEMANAGTLTEKTLLEKYPKVVEALSGLNLTTEEGVSNIQVFLRWLRQEAKALGETSKQAENSAFSKSEMISKINGLSEGFESLDKVMNSIKDKDKPFDYALLDDKKFTETFSGLGETYTNFIEKVSNSPKDINACQSAFNDLTTDWLNSTGIIEGLSDETAQLTIDMLSNMGVANAEEVVTEALTAKHAALAAEKYYNANASETLKNATVGEYVQFLNEANGAEVSKTALAQLELSKLAVNNAKINTSSDIDQVIALANAAGASAAALLELQRAKSILSNIESNSLDMNVTGNNMLQAYAKNVIDKIENGAFDFKFEKLNPSEFKTAIYNGGPKTNSPGSNKDKSDRDNSTDFDWMERKIKVIDDQVDKLKNKIELLVGYKAKNATTNTAMDLMIDKMNILQQMHDRYMQQANSLGLAQEYIDKIQNGAIDYQTIDDKKLSEKIKDYQTLYDKAVDCNNQIIETQQSIHDLNLSKLDNIINQFEQLTDIQSQMIDTEKELLSLREKSGESIEANDYTSLVEKQLALTRQNAEAYHALVDEMSKLDLKQGSEEWKKYNDQLQDYKNNMISAADAIEEYKDAMTELMYKELDDFKSKMDSINGTIDTMNSLIGDTNLVDENGKLTDRGLAQVALYAQQYLNAKQEAAEYNEAIESLDDALESGLITQDEYNSMLYEYTSAQESAVLASKESRDAILSLVKEGIQAEIDAKKKLIDETKAALEAEQDLHDYQESIAEKSSNISKLERQIAALSNSTDRADIAQKLQLQQELAEAQKDLYETQYDHEMEQRKDALDKEYEAFEESKNKEMDELDSNLDAQEAAIKKYLEEVKSNYSTVYGILTQYGNEYSLSAIDSLTEPWDSSSDAANLCADAIGEVTSNIQYEIDNLDFSKLYELVDLLEQVGLNGYGSGGVDFEDISGTGKWQKGKGGRWWYGEDYDPDGNYDYASDGIYTIDGKQYGFDDNGYMQTEWQEHNGKQYYFDANDGHMIKSEWIPGRNGTYYYLTADGSMAENMAIKSKDGNDYYYVDGSGKWDGKTLTKDEVRKKGYAVGYRNGTTKAKKGLNLMDEDGLGSEVIISKYGVLQQFKGGEHVFNSEQTNRLWDISKNPKDYIYNIVNQKIPKDALNSIKRNQNVNVDINIGGVLDESTMRILNNEFVPMLKKNSRIISDSVAKEIKWQLKK